MDIKPDVKSVEPLHIFADIRGHAAADVGLISLQKIADPLVVIATGGGIVGLDEGLGHRLLPACAQGVGQGGDGSGGGGEEQAPACGGIDLSQIVDHLLRG